MGLKVVKFGGSSLADAKQFQKVAEIIKADAERRYVVVSAPGKRFSEDEKVTDLLYACYKAIHDEAAFEAIFKKITDRYDGIIHGLGIDLDLCEEYEAIRFGLKHKAGRDFTASRGEYLNGLILAHYLGFDFINASDMIYFNEQGVYDAETTLASCRRVLSEHQHAVIPGFYGSMPNDTIKTFSRGGSDVTGSIIAGATRADLYENWTDVSGFCVADPRIIKQPKLIDTISYKELRELSYMGASVLHEDSIFPVQNAGIPINIKNTNRPEDRGTFIVAEVPPNDQNSTITGIAGRKGFSVINIEKNKMNNELGFGRRVLQVLERHGVSFEHLPSGIDTMSVIVPSAQIEKVKSELISELCAQVVPDMVEIVDGLALVAVVGRGMIRTKGTAARVCTALYDAQVNIKMIDQGSSEINIIIGIDEADFERAIAGIYRAFFA